MTKYARSETNQSENNEVEETQDEREHSIVSRRIQNNNKYMTTYARAGNSSNDDGKIVDLPEDLNFIFGNNNLEGMCRLTKTERWIRNIPQKLSNQCYSIITIDEVKYAIQETLKEMKTYCDGLRNLALMEHNAYENSSSGSDSDDDNNNEPDLPDEVLEIEQNYMAIAAFLVHVASLPIHDLDLRAKKLELASGKYMCFCPFGNTMNTYQAWVEDPIYQFLLDKTCTKPQLKG